MVEVGYGRSPFNTRSDAIHKLVEHLRPFTGGLEIDQVAEGIIQFTLPDRVGNDLALHISERLLTLLDVRHVLRDDLSRPRHISALRNLGCYLLVKSLPHIRRRATDHIQRLIDRLPRGRRAR